MIAFAFHTAAQQRAASTIPPNNSGTVLGGTGTINGSVSIASSGAILEGGTVPLTLTPARRR